MLRGIQQRDLDRNRWIKISMGVILLLICVSMVVTLVPGLMSGPSTDASSPDAIASVAGHNISVVEFQQRFDQLMSNQQIPQMMRGVYAKQLLNDLVFQQALDYEAQQMGIEVTPQEEAARIRQMIPDAWVNNEWDAAKYQTDVEQGTGMSVTQFETALHDEMLTDKFRQLVTDGITVSPAEVEQEFRWRNDRVKLQYALIKPSELAATIQPTDAQLQAWFNQNKSRYQIPEKRSATYALLDLAQLRANTKPTDAELQAYYQAHLADYKVENRVHVEHILFKTVGKTDAESPRSRKRLKTFWSRPRAARISRIWRRSIPRTMARRPRAVIWAGFCKARRCRPSSRPRSAYPRARFPTWCRHPTDSRSSKFSTGRRRTPRALPR